MRSTFLYILFGLAATAMAVPSGVEPAGKLLPKLLPKAEKRQVSAVGGIRSREIGGGFIAVLPQGSLIPADGDGGPNTKRRFLRKDEVVVPDSLRGPSSKRAPSCESGYGLCPGRGYCCPVDGRCCSFRGCCPATHNCVTVDGVNGCCPIGEVCTATGNACADPGYVPCNNGDFCCKPGYTCYRDSLGNDRCRAPGSNDDYTSRSVKSVTVKVPEETTSTDVQVHQATNTISIALLTTTPLPAAAKSTSSAPMVSSNPSNSDVVANGAIAASFQGGHLFLMVPVLFALGQGLVVA